MADMKMSRRTFVGGSLAASALATLAGCATAGNSDGGSDGSGVVSSGNMLTTAMRAITTT